MTKLFKSLAILSLLSISACSVHKLDVQQGNVITQEMFDQLSVGLERRHVIRTVGVPLIQDPFHKDRWEYIYSMKFGGTQNEQYSYFTLFFENDKISKIEVAAKVFKEKELIMPKTLRSSGL